MTNIQATLKPQKVASRIVMLNSAPDIKLASETPDAFADIGTALTEGKGRITSSTNGTTPIKYTKPNSGVADAKPDCSINIAVIGVTNMPPTDNPVVETDIASARLSINQRAISVVAGNNPDAENPMPKNKYRA